MDLGSHDSVAVNVDDVQVEVRQSDNPHNHLLDEDFFQLKKRWSRGIQIYRLVSGKFQPKDFDDEIKKQQEVENERRRRQEEEERQNLLLQNGGLNDPQTVQKNRKALQIAFNDKSTPRAITNLRIVMNVVMASVIALASAEFVVNNAQFNNINENFNLIEYSYSRVSEVQRIAYDVRTLVNINEGLQTVYQNYTNSSDFIAYLKNDIQEAMNSLFALEGNISLTALPQQARQSQLSSQKSVNLTFMQRNGAVKVIAYTLHEAVLQVSSAIFTVLNLNLTAFYED